MESANGQSAMNVSGFLPNGLKVYFTMPVNMNNAFEDALAFTNMLLTKGFTQQEPGLGKGEHRELIGLVARREKTNRDGSISTVLDLYAADPSLSYRYMGVYLDTPEDVRAFEQASGLKIDKLPLNLADSPPSKDNTRLVVSPVKPLTVVYTNNPDYDETSEAKKPKRLFVRWDGLAQISNVEGSNSSAPVSTGENIPDGIELIAVRAVVKTTQNNKPFLVLESEGGQKVSLFTRDPLRAVGYDCEGWTEVNKTYVIDPPAAVLTEQDGQYLKFKSLMKADSKIIPF